MTTTVTESSDVIRETVFVSAALDSATPATLLAETIDIGRTPRPPSVFDLTRIGISPSSSYTVGPMRTGHAFSRVLAEVIHPDGVGGFDSEYASSIPGAGLPQPGHVTVELYDSLDAIGRGHVTDRIATVGLAGYEPKTVPAVVCESLMGEAEATDELAVDGVGPIPLSPSADIYLLPGRILPYHISGTTLTAYCTNSAEILRRAYYSAGGGFVIEDASTPGSPSTQALAIASTTQAHITPAPFSFATSAAMLMVCEHEDLSASGVVLVNELSTHNREEVMAYLDRLCVMMRACIETGMNAEDIPPGGLDVCRCAGALYEQLHAQSTEPAATFTMTGPLHGMDWVDLFALAVSEENTAGRRVAAVPTNDAVGIVSAALAYYEHFIPGADDDGTHRFLLATTVVGGLIKTNTSVTGTEVDYQGEVGSVSPMAVAGLAEVLGGAPAQIENATKIATGHNLGLTCDPIDGPVQIPCIECNAVVTVRAINATRMAL